MNSEKNHYAVIMAGGVGTRLWPLSREKKPKQFQKLISENTMIQETFERIAQVVPNENIYISTAEQYIEIIREQFPQVSERQLIIEPMAKNTAPAINLAAEYIHRINPNAIIASVASDHAIKNVDEFVLSLKTAFQSVEKNPEKLVLIGITPTHPHTGLGHIELGQEIHQISGKHVFEVNSFKEKPDLETAKQYTESGKYLWNASYFIFSAQTMLNFCQRLIPETAKAIHQVVGIMNSAENDKNKIAEIFSEIVSEPIDTAISEKLKPEDLLVVPSDLIWSDIGDWVTLASFLKNDFEKSEAESQKIVTYDCKNCFIQPYKRLIAAVGLDDIVIIDTEDATLIAKKDRVQDVKKIIEELKKNGKQQLL